MSEQAARVLERTAEVLERDGWTKGSFSVFGRRCLVGGLSRATRDELGLGPNQRPKEFRKLREEAIQLLCQQLDLDHNDPRTRQSLVVVWNDSVDRRKPEVLDVLHKSAKRALGVIEEEI